MEKFTVKVDMKENAETILLQNECHTMANLLQNSLSKKKDVAFVGYRKKDSDVELFLTTKNNCLGGKNAIISEVLDDIEKRIDMFTLNLSHVLDKKK